ncbi:hypothetical protein [Mycobacterium sp. NPDC050853]|uniref:hypothetical protein n=1 Tax=Mycobacterium sp. NPDC050853 TaxID=3155160 RepID=UPI0033DBF459
MIAVVALVFSILVSTGHRGQVTSDRYDSRVLGTAVSWVNTLINMNKGNVGPSVQALQDGAAGRLSDELGATIAGFVQLARTLDTDAVGEIDSVAIERAGPHDDADVGLPSAERTDRVMVVATSVTRAANAPAKVNPWYLRLAVSKVGDQLLVTDLRVIQ